MSTYLTPYDLKPWFKDVTDVVKENALTLLKSGQDGYPNAKNAQEVFIDRLIEHASERAFAVTDKKEAYTRDNTIDFIEHYYQSEVNDDYHIYSVDKSGFDKLKKMAFILGMDFNELFNGFRWFMTNKDIFGVVITSHDIFNPPIIHTQNLETDYSIYRDICNFSDYNIKRFFAVANLFRCPDKLDSMYDFKGSLRIISQSKQNLSFRVIEEDANNIKRKVIANYILVYPNQAYLELQERVIDNDLYQAFTRQSTEHHMLHGKDLLERIYNEIDMKNIPSCFMRVH